jgi:sterol 3beta-glucosyltransferase
MTRIVVIAAGTLGDVLPAMRVAALLGEKGNRVQLATHCEYHALSPPGLELADLPYSPSYELTSGHARRLAAPRGGNVSRAIGGWHLLRSNFLNMARAVLERARDAELLLYSGVAAGGGHVAEALRVPAARLYYRPAWRTGQIPSPLLSTERDFGRGLNRMSHLVIEAAAQLTLRKRIQQFRSELGLDCPDWRRSADWITEGPGGPDVHSIFAIPTRFATKEMVAKPKVALTGFVHPRVDHLSTNSWADAIQSIDDIRLTGRPVVAVALSSLEARAAARGQFLAELGQALRDVGALAVIQSPAIYQMLRDRVPGLDICAVPFGDHRALFSVASAVVHQGGSGTTAAGLASGKPVAILPFWFDQFYWAAQMKKLGAAAPIRSYRLMNQIAARRTVDFLLSDRARDCAEGLTPLGSDGADLAVAAIEATL